jgi:hypothetical protein
MKITTLKIPTFSHKSLAVILFLAAFSGFNLLLSPKVSAVVPNFVVNNRGGIPSAITTDPGGVEGIVDCHFRYASYQWVSQTPDSASRFVSIPYGTPAVLLKFNVLAAACNNNIQASGNIIHKDKDITQYNVVSSSATLSGSSPVQNYGIAGLNGTAPQVTHSSCYAAPNCRYFKQSRNGWPANQPFFVTGIGSLPVGDNVITVTVESRTITKGLGANDFACVKLLPATPSEPFGVIQDASSLTDSACGTVTQSYDIIIHVDPPTDVSPSGSASADCKNLNISGAEDSNYPSKGVIYEVFNETTGAKIGDGTADPTANNAIFGLFSRGMPFGTIMKVAFWNYDYTGTVDNSGTKVHWVTGINYTPGPTCPNYEIKESPSVKLKAADGTTDDDEDPKNAEFSGNVVATSIYGGPITVNNVTVTCAYRLEKAGGADGTPASWVPKVQPGQNVSSTPSSANCGPTKALPPTVAIGDKICLRITVSPGTGRVDASGNRMNTAPEADTTKEECVRIVGKPYVTFLGSDIRSGQTCPTATVGAINTNSKLSGGSSFGSSTQFAAFALGAISGMGSSLNFAQPNGNFGSYPGCRAGFAAKPGADPGATMAIGASGTFAHAGNLTITGGAVGNGQKTYIYVTGNVNITNPITFSSSGWSSRADIPSLYVYASGNITIAPTVSKLFGVYNAQGIIDTCSPADTSDSGAMWSTCSNQLVVDGAFSARKINLKRTFGSLRNATNPATCTVPGGKCAAEIFNFGPALFFGEAPTTSITPGLDTKKFDFITSLPPFL